MGTIINVDRDDEIADLIGRVRATDERDVAIVLPADAAVFQTPLNVRLLSQFASRDNRSISVIAGDPRLQQMAKERGFPTFASVTAYERGVELVQPRRVVEAAETGGGVAVAPAPTATATVAAPVAPPAPPKVATPLPPPGPSGGGERRRPLYFGLIALGVVGLVLFLVLSPAARITVTLNAVPVSTSPTIIGVPDAASAAQGDHILTTVATADEGPLTFQGTPSGQKQLPPVAATGQVVLIMNSSSPFYAQAQTQPVSPFQAPMSQGYQFETSDNPPKVFAVTQTTTVTFTVQSPGGQPTSNPIPVAALTAGTAGNVKEHQINQFGPSGSDPHGENPCANPQPNQPCGSPNDFTPDNPQPTSGGADGKNVTVASDQDLASWNAQVQQLEKSLTDKVNADLLSKAAGDSFAVDPSGGGKTISFAVNPPLPTSGQTFGPTTFSISVHAKATLYNPTDVQNVLIHDLQSQVPQGDTLITGRLNLTTISVITASDDGHIAMSTTGTDYYSPDVQPDQLKDEITGHSCDDARKIIEHHIDRVQSVDCQEHPFPLPFLPFFAHSIEFDLNYVTPPPQKTS